jgi:putative ABC transport system permease protein
MFEELWQDLRFGVRMLRKAPGFTAIAVLTIALGIGATTAIFTVVDATLLEPLPYPQPEQLVSIQDNFPGIGAQDVGMSQPEWQDLQHSGIFEYISPTWFDENNLTGSSQPARVRLLIVAPNYFALLGVQPRLGRGFSPQDAGIIPEVVISDGLWGARSGAIQNILSRACEWTRICIASSASCRQVSTPRDEQRKKGISRSGRPLVFMGHRCLIIRREIGAIFRPQSPA